MSTRSPRKAALASRTKSQTAFLDPLKGVDLDGKGDIAGSSDSEDAEGSQGESEELSDAISGGEGAKDMKMVQQDDDNASEVDMENESPGRDVTLGYKPVQGRVGTPSPSKAGSMSKPKTPSNKKSPGSANKSASVPSSNSTNTSSTKSKSAIGVKQKVNGGGKSKKRPAPISESENDEDGNGSGDDNDGGEDDAADEGYASQEEPVTPPAKTKAKATPKNTPSKSTETGHKPSPTKKQNISAPTKPTKQTKVKAEPEDDPNEYDPALEENVDMDGVKDEDGDEDVKPKVNGKSPKAKTAPRKAARSQLSGGGGGGDKFVTTPANRVAMMEEMLLQVATTKMDWTRVKDNAGMVDEDDEKKLAKYFTQTFKKHLLTSVASEAFGKK